MPSTVRGADRSSVPSVLVSFGCVKNAISVAGCVELEQRDGAGGHRDVLPAWLGHRERETRNEQLGLVRARLQQTEAGMTVLALCRPPGCRSGAGSTSGEAPASAASSRSVPPCLSLRRWVAEWQRRPQRPGLRASSPTPDRRQPGGQRRQPGLADICWDATTWLDRSSCSPHGGSRVPGGDVGPECSSPPLGSVTVPGCRMTRLWPLRGARPDLPIRRRSRPRRSGGGSRRPRAPAGVLRARGRAHRGRPHPAADRDARGAARGRPRVARRGR